MNARRFVLFEKVEHIYIASIMVNTIAIVASLDTKGYEVEFAKALVEKTGLKALLIDTSVRNQPVIKPDISSKEILSMCGIKWSDMEKLEKVQRIEIMTTTLTTVLNMLYQEGRFQGVFSLGGGQNTIMATSAMKKLPFGVPKFMLSTMASGKRTFGPVVGTKDIIVMHSVADISGLNPITKNVISNAVNAVVGMLKYATPIEKCSSKITIGTSMLGVTSRGVSEIELLLKDKGYEVITFHANGVGGMAMEEMVRNGTIKGVMDITTHELTSEIHGGYCSGAEGRLKIACEMKIPQVIAPGAVDVIDFCTANGYGDFPTDWKSRKQVWHNSTIVHLKANKEEILKVANLMAERLNKAIVPIVVLLPTKGFCEAGAPGGQLCDNEIDMAFNNTLKNLLKKDIKCIVIDSNINDKVFAKIAVEEMLKIMN